VKAILDLGTNTFNLLVATLKAGKLEIEVNEELPVMLGDEGGLENGLISEMAIKRANLVIQNFADHISKYEIDEIKAFGTSALRDCKNGNEITDKVKELLNIQPEVISGEREAELIWKGVQLAAENNTSVFLMMDIGGGSVEFVIGKGGQIFWKKSYPLGAVRLLKKFSSVNPIAKSTIELIDEFLNNELNELFAEMAKHQIQYFIGSAGSFDSLREVVSTDLKMQTKKYSEHVTVIEKPAFILCHQLILRSGNTDLRKFSGIPEYRIRTIPYAMILMKKIMERGNFTKILVSEYALKEGAIV